MSTQETKKILATHEKEWDDPEDAFIPDLKERILKTSRLHDHLSEQIIGQQHVLTPFTSIVQEGYCHLSERGRTRGNFFFLGPTGTGKTELVKEATNYLYGKDAFKNLLRIDMSEYSQGDDGLERLIGSPKTGGGRMGAFLEQAQEGFILYDEIEKAKPGFFTIMLQQLDDARITLGDNKTHDLSKFFIICTSNVGANIFQNTKELTDTRIQKALESLLQERFSPEFIARFGQHGWGVLTFKPLTPATLRLISQKFFKNEIRRFKKLNFHAHGYDENCHEIVLSQINSTKNGAREIRNIVKRLVQSCVNATFRSDHSHIENGVEGWLHYTQNNSTGIASLHLEKEKKEGVTYVHTH